MGTKAFYLKVNRKEAFALKNLSRWIDVSYLLKADCYIICDSDELKMSIENDLLLYRDVDFIKSNKDAELQYIVNNIANRNWVNAAYAHLTSFWHARGKYTFFWNIDADDTRMCVSIDRMAEILLEAEKYAETNGIDCFSLDMWRSETCGKHWSFGITYISGNCDWLELCKQRCLDKEYKLMDNEGNQNVDWFFTYLKSCTEKQIETFYIENMRFIHYSNDFFEKPVGSGLYHWRNGQLRYPLVCDGFGLDEIGVYNIATDVIKLDIGISDVEAQSFFTYYAREGKDLSGFYDVDELINSDICREKSEVFKLKHGYEKADEPEIICFGAGNALEKNINKIKKICNLEYVCDNDSGKWGRKIVDNVVCISPEELKGKENVIVIILVYSKNIARQIAKQLEVMGIKYDYMDNWFACVE